MYLFTFTKGLMLWSVYQHQDRYKFRNCLGNEFYCMSWQEGRESVMEGWIK